MPKPISTNSQSEPNACYEPEFTATESVEAVRCEPQPSPQAPDTPASSPAVQQLVSRAAVPSVPAGTNAGSTGVLLCRRVADIPLNEYAKIQHHYIVTEEKAAGAVHCGSGVPGHGQIDLPLSPMCINDHASEVGTPGVVCDQVEADPACVDRLLEFDKPIGRWAPSFNDCQTFAASVIEQCRTRTEADIQRATGAEGARGY